MHNKSFPWLDSSFRTHSEIAGVGRLIRSVNTFDFPNDLLGFIRMLFPVDNVVTLGFASDKLPIELFRDFPEKAGYEFSRRYHQGAYLLDPFYQLCTTAAPNGLYSLTEISPDRFFQSEYYKAYYCKAPLIDELAYIYPVSNDWHLAYSLARGAHLGRYTSAEIESARRLEPVLGPLMVKHWGSDVLREGRKDPLLHASAAAHRIYEVALTLRPKGISPREAEVAALILQGHSSYSIATRLEIAVGTVKVLRKRLYRKLDISTQNELYMKLIPAVIETGS